jgi:S1-C subfamily serine protease
VKRVLPDLISMGHPYRPPLGIDGVEITPEISDLFGIPARRGYLVERVLPGSLGERAGLLAGTRMVLLSESVYVLGGDILTAINGEEISSGAQIARILLLSRPGEILTIRLLREGEWREVSVPLEAMHWR